MFSMSRDGENAWPGLGLDEDEATLLGSDAATRIRTFRLVLVLAQRLRTLMDQRLQADGLTTQQAALITVVDAIGTPSLSQVASALSTTHQNAKQIAAALERKGFIRIAADATDRRVRRLVTTVKSRAYWERRSPDDYDVVLEWFSVLSETEAATLFELLLRVDEQARRPARPPSTAPTSKAP
jgi:DNA-binding MarR family transcriptional regulator